VPPVRPALYLYTAPPKTTLKDLDSTLYAQQFIPAVHIHVGVDSKKAQGLAADFQGPFLLPEVAARMQDGPPQEQGMAAGVVTETAAGRAEGGSSSREQGLDVAAAVRAAASGQQAQERPGGGKVPKWLKMGPK
jgi:hypothetical protein